MSEEFKAIETQEQLNNIIEERLKRDRESRSKAYEGYLSPEEVEKLKKGYENTITGLNKQIEDSSETYKNYDTEIANRDAKIKEYETASVKSRIAHETGLPYDAIAFLQGEDEESIKKSAESLKGLVGNGASTPPPVTNLPDLKGDKKAVLRQTLSELRE